MKRIWMIPFFTALALSFLVEFLLRNSLGHGEFPWSSIPGFFALFGFISCVLIIAVSKLLGHYWLQRKENYYDRDEDDK